MAEKMMPYALRMTLAVLANKPDDARSISAECVTAMTKELMGVVSRYDYCYTYCHEYLISVPPPRKRLVRVRLRTWDVPPHRPPLCDFGPISRLRPRHAPNRDGHG